MNMLHGHCLKYIMRMSIFIGCRRVEGGPDNIPRNNIGYCICILIVLMDRYPGQLYKSYLVLSDQGKFGELVII